MVQGVGLTYLLLLLPLSAVVSFTAKLLSEQVLVFFYRKRKHQDFIIWLHSQVENIAIEGILLYTWQPQH